MEAITLRRAGLLDSADQRLYRQRKQMPDAA